MEGIRRAGDATTSRVTKNVGIDHGRLDVLVAEKLLNGSDVVARHEQMGRDAVAKGVAADLL